MAAHPVAHPPGHPLSLLSGAELATQQALARTLGSDWAAVCHQVHAAAHSGRRGLWLFWRRRQVELELQRLANARQVQALLWLPRNETGCARCRNRHNEVIPVDTPAASIVPDDCMAFVQRSCPLMVGAVLPAHMLAACSKRATTVDATPPAP